MTLKRPSKITVLEEIQKLARTAAIARMQGRLQQAFEIESSLERSAIYAERQGWTDNALSAEEAGRIEARKFVNETKTRKRDLQQQQQTHERSKCSSVPKMFKDARVKVLSNPMNNPGRYFASWYLDDSLKPVILLDEPVAEAIRKGKLNISFTLEHEYDEAMLALALAAKSGHSKSYMLKNFTGPDPIAEYELDVLGGDAHQLLTAKFPGGTKLFNRLADHEWNIAYKK